MAIQTANLESSAQNTDQIYLFFFILFIDIPVCLFLQMAVGTLNTLSIEQLLQNVVLRIFEFILRAILTLKHVVILCLRIECASMTCWRISSDETQPRMNFSSSLTIQKLQLYLSISYVIAITSRISFTDTMFISRTRLLFKRESTLNDVCDLCVLDFTGFRLFQITGL